MTHTWAPLSVMFLASSAILAIAALVAWDLAYLEYAFVSLLAFGVTLVLDAAERRAGRKRHENSPQQRLEDFTEDNGQ